MDDETGGTAARQEYRDQGFHLAPGLIPRPEAERLRAHVHDLGTRPRDLCEPDAYDPGSTDPLRRHPRLMQPHRSDPAALAFLLDQRLRRILVELLGEEPTAVQTMIYFKPAGARGQALHQDQRYLQVSPGTCVAAWLALDPTDRENGCLQVVPGSHRLEVLCPIRSDTSRSFTSETVPVPPGMCVVHVAMDPGDVLFFHGNLIHGSEPNTSTDRFRTVIVGHYATGDAERISDWYPDAVSFDGRPVDLERVASGGPCGELVGRTVQVTSTISAALARH
jgi:phytanoyl-CoA hydroxylase